MQTFHQNRHTAIWVMWYSFRLVILLLAYAFVIVLMWGSLGWPQERPLVLVQQQEELTNDKYAIVIGINDYSDEDIMDLRYCEADVQLFASTLTEVCGYPKDHVVTLLGKGASFENVYRALRSLSDRKLYPTADTIVIYFAGHGACIEDKSYFVPWDGSADPVFVKAKNVPISDLYSLVGKSGFKRQVMLFDACRNTLRADGRALSAERGLVQTSLAEDYAKGMKVMMATESGEFSREDAALGHGLFTYTLAKGLSGAAADENGLITFGNLDQYVFNEMAAYSRQNPGRRQIPVSFGEAPSAMPLAVVQPGAVLSLASASPAPSPEPPPSPVPQPPKTDFTVAKSGKADFTSISEAISKVTAGSTIHVMPGTYTESVGITKDVEIVGSTPREIVILECADNEALCMQTDHAIVRGLTIKGKCANAKAVHLGTGSLVLKDCDISSASSGCIYVEGAQTAPAIQKCKVHGSPFNAIQIADGARGLVEDCEFYGNGYPALVVKSSADPVVRRCTIHDNQGCGILVMDNGRGTFEQCNAYQNGDTNLTEESGANAHFTNCKFYEVRGSNNVILRGGSIAELSNCEITGSANDYPIVWMNEKANATFRGCKICSGDGVWVLGESKAAFSDTRICCHTDDGVTVRDNSFVEVESCTITSNEAAALYFDKDGGGKVTNSDLTGNKAGSYTLGDKPGQIERYGNSEESSKGKNFFKDLF